MYSSIEDGYHMLGGEALTSLTGIVRSQIGPAHSSPYSGVQIAR